MIVLLKCTTVILEYPIVILRNIVVVGMTILSFSVTSSLSLYSYVVKAYCYIGQYEGVYALGFLHCLTIDNLEF